jgi:hypothetical protein
MSDNVYYVTFIKSYLNALQSFVYFVEKVSMLVPRHGDRRHSRTATPAAGISEQRNPMPPVQTSGQLAR